MSAVFKAPNPGYLLISDNPLTFDSSIRALDNEQISGLFGFKYEENIFLPGPLSDFKFGHEKDLCFIWKKINERLENPLNKSLVVCLIDDEVGYGVFTREFIEAGTIIGIYAGEIEFKYTRGEKKYGMILHEDLDFRIDAGPIGGIGRFIQHMPFDIDKIISQLLLSSNTDTVLKILDGNGIFFSDEKDLKFIDYIRRTKKIDILDAFIKQQIEVLKEKTSEEQKEMKGMRFLKEKPGLNLTTANVQQRPIVFQNKPGMYLQALCDIHPGEQLGLSYGLPYWRTRGCIPKYFDKQGHVIPEENYLTIEEIALSKIDNVYMPEFRGLEWRKYPKERIPEKLSGHDIRFFNFQSRAPETSLRLVQDLKAKGFDIQLKPIKNGHDSIVVDLTNSSQAMSFFAHRESKTGTEVHPSNIMMKQMSQ